MQTVNRANEQLRTRGYAFGTWFVCVRNPVAVRLAAEAGFDYVYIDTEHSSFSWETVSDLCQMAVASGLTPIVRLDTPNRDTTARALDIGAMGIMFHDVESPYQVEEIMSWTAGSKIAARTGDTAAARRNLTVIIEIESKAGLDALDDILGAGDIDVVEIGRGDLTASLGHGNDRWHPDVVAAIDEIVAGCKRHGVAAGMTSTQLKEDEIEFLVDHGFTWITFGTDERILRSGYERGLQMMTEATAVAAAR